MGPSQKGENKRVTLKIKQSRPVGSASSSKEREHLRPRCNCLALALSEDEHNNLV